MSGSKFAIIIDEAHQGQSGESAKTLRRSLLDIDKAIKEYAEEEVIVLEFLHFHHFVLDGPHL